jgi:hypothetical protein
VAKSVLITKGFKIGISDSATIVGNSDVLESALLELDDLKKMIKCEFKVIGGEPAMGCLFC